MSKPTLPQGTRDFAPETVRKRSYILNTIKTVFELYGFQPLETPAMENMETLMGKYGDEGDKLIFRILNNGLNDPKNIDRSRAAFENVVQGKNDKNLTERALRYDLTIPFARFVAMNHGQLVFPFKRYQVQPVWRADRPQKGRYREFYQCDADVVGSKSLINEVEFVHIYTDVFKRLKIEGVEIRINSRKILAALAEKCGGADKLTDITIAIDKLEKIGVDKLKEELSLKGLSGEQISVIEQYLSISGNNRSKIEQLNNLLNAEAGISELNFILSKISPSIPLVIDFTLARGLNYYTGIIFEVKAPASVKIGSIGGGGRYDDLTGLFGVPNIPGVGISFGVDRIYDVMEELNVFPADINVSSEVLFLNTDEQKNTAAFNVLQLLRSKGVRGEIYPEAAKIDKQFKYAEKKNIPFVVSIEEGKYKLKNIINGTQQLLSETELLGFDF
ncbi:MAG: histidine--tRNA ligase [Chitinophagaceae bacterium]|nr:histidine--tRNA ligase [Chitinophagaceae bacterium]